MSDIFIGIFGGVCIALGCCGYAASGNILFGAVIFSMGLLIIKQNHFKLYTGAIGRFHTISEFIECIAILCFNLVGCTLVGFIIIHSPNLYTNLISIATTKDSLPLIQLFFMAIPCGFIMYFATKPEISELQTIICVALFIIAGFEHSIADSFYLLFTDSIKMYYVKIGIIALGNGIGANIGSRLILEKN